MEVGWGYTESARQGEQKIGIEAEASSRAGVRGHLSLRRSSERLRLSPRTWDSNWARCCCVGTVVGEAGTERRQGRSAGPRPCGQGLVHEVDGRPGKTAYSTRWTMRLGWALALGTMGEDYGNRDKRRLQGFMI